MAQWNNGQIPNAPNLPPQPARPSGGRAVNTRAFPNNKRGGPGSGHGYHGAPPIPQSPAHHQLYPLPYLIDSYGSAALDGPPSLKRARMDPNQGIQFGLSHVNGSRGFNGGRQAPVAMSYNHFEGAGFKNGINYSNPLPNALVNSGKTNMYHQRKHHNQPNFYYNNNNGNSSAGRTRIYSDFRISKVTIGTFVVDESHLGSGTSASTRDSRLRLYFRNSNDSLHSTPSTLAHLSARERALTEPDRLSISLYQGKKRIIIPVQEGLDKVRFNREDGHFYIKSRAWALFEELDPSSSTGGNSKAGQFRRCNDFTQTQLEAANGVIEVWTDKNNPLPMEPKWTRGNLHDYIDARSKFLTQGILEVDDPQRIIDFDSVVGLWTQESRVETLQERERFVENELCRLDYMLELTSKILAPPHYYVSRNAAVTAVTAAASTSSSTGSSTGSSTNSNISGSAGSNSSHASSVAQILETGQIPALISPSVNALIAITYHLAITNVNSKSDASLEAVSAAELHLVSLLKTVVYQVPEPILWRSLDGLFGKRNEPLNFNAQSVMEKLESKTQKKEAAIAASKVSSSPNATVVGNSSDQSDINEALDIDQGSLKIDLPENKDVPPLVEVKQKYAKDEIEIGTEGLGSLNIKDELTEPESGKVKY